MNQLKTVVLFRCTEKQYAEAFFNTGCMKFNTPKYWIDLEKTDGKGRGDLLEGAYLACDKLDLKSIIENRNSRTNNKSEFINNLVYFKSDNVLELPCYCLFSLFNTNISEETIDQSGNVHHYYTVSKQYFYDFCDNTTKEMNMKLSDEKKPVLLMIMDPTEFFRRVISYFNTLGVTNEEILVQPVEYVDKKSPFVSTGKPPYELFLKDMTFSHQNEVRIIVNTNDRIREELSKNNNIVNIGSLKDITCIEEFHYNDMLFDINGRNMWYTRPEPLLFNSLEELSEEDLLDLAFGVKYNFHLNIRDDEKETVMTQIIDVLKNKYQIFDLDYRLSNSYARCFCDRD